MFQQELAETAQKLSLAESSLGIQKKVSRFSKSRDFEMTGSQCHQSNVYCFVFLQARDSLEEERDHLRQTLRTYEEQVGIIVKIWEWFL